MKPIKVLILAFFFITACTRSSDQNTGLSAHDSTATQSSIDTSAFIDEESLIHMDYEEFYESGALKIEGNFDDINARNGLWISYYEDGKKWSESFYIHGKKEGHSLTFFPNGKIRYVGEYKNDEKTGLWRFYNESGDLEKEETY